MDEKLLSLEVNVASERKEACEWLSLTSHVEEHKYRQFSADLERRRRRKYNLHLEEKKLVEKELDNLQKDRQRFEREKQLRRRKSCSASKIKKQSSQKKETASNFPFHGDALGGSASIAFDPKVEKRSRRRRKAKTESMTKKAKGQSNNELDESSTNFPYLSENEVVKFHQSCKSAGLRNECRRWGAAWLYAKKEQDLTPNKDQRWNTLLLNAEKEKMRSLCAKWMAVKEKRLSTCWTIGVTSPTSSRDKQSREKETKHPENDQKGNEDKESSINFKEHCENIKAAQKISTTIPSNKQIASKEKVFAYPFSKVKAVNAWSLKQDGGFSSGAKTTVQEDQQDVNQARTKLHVIKEVTKIEVTTTNSSTSQSKLQRAHLHPPSKSGQNVAFLPEL